MHHYVQFCLALEINPSVCARYASTVLTEMHVNTHMDMYTHTHKHLKKISKSLLGENIREYY